MEVRRDKDHPAQFTGDFASREAWERRAALLRRQVLVSQGLWPMPQRTPLKPVITAKIDRAAYSIENLSIESTPGHRVFGNLYRPKHTVLPMPVVLHPYGHWPDGRFNWQSEDQIDKQLESGAEVDRNAARAPLQAFSATLAQMGCIVFHYDMVGFCDSRPISHTEGFEDAQAVLRLQSNMGLQTWNSIRALDYVLSLPGVDSTRIAVTGASGGGTQSFMLTAVDDRITCSLPIVMISMNMQGGCVCENAPLVRIGTNNIELAALAAPRPLGAVGAHDWTHDFESRGLPELKKIYRLYDAEDRIDGKVFPFPHNLNLHSRRWCYAFLRQHLNLRQPDPSAERLEPVHPDQLRVVLPDGVAGELAGVTELRRRITAADQQAMEQLNKPAMLRDALEAVVAADDFGTLANVPELPRTFNGNAYIWLGEKAHNCLPVSSLVVSPAYPNPVRIEGHPAMVLGYNRSALASRVNAVLQLLTALEAMPEVRRIRLISTKDSEVIGTIAAVVSGDRLDLAIIQRSDFEFDQVTDVNDPLCFPGALKYGGMKAFRRLCSPRVRFVEDPASTLCEFITRK